MEGDTDVAKDVGDDRNWRVRERSMEGRKEIADLRTLEGVARDKSDRD